ncbi:4111_t:CDS:2 [Ambispora leptoticha]|uniref:chitin deacetylase n=1 Tax=Ambispora leptoticha TaxID=144679 RepID=A0A9N8VEL1_9GLOM|nr:4111_t:CDS:2 [Ambispora leptoticha]
MLNMLSVDATEKNSSKSNSNNILSKSIPSNQNGYLDPKIYPPLDQPPPINSSFVQEWAKKTDWNQVPNFRSTTPGNCSDIEPDACNWACQKCERPSDIVVCPGKETWGMSYDDGPSVYTPKVLDLLQKYSLHSTLFVVGSRVVQHPLTLIAAYRAGHHIAVHTWSHRSLTSLDNLTIIAELQWTQKIIYDVLGITPIYMRPPFGDIDDRVRSIAVQLGYIVSIWTRGFDTQDWQLPEHKVTPQEVIINFSSFLQNSTKMNSGFIVLQHDLWPETVQISVDVILPTAINTPNMQIMSISECLVDGKPYKEGVANSNKINSLLDGNQSDDGIRPNTTMMINSAFSVRSCGLWIWIADKNHSLAKGELGHFLLYHKSLKIIGPGYKACYQPSSFAYITTIVY